MIKNTKPLLIDDEKLIFQPYFRVEAVYDTNGNGEKVSVEFDRLAGILFKLRYNPYGEISCDIEI